MLKKTFVFIFSLIALSSIGQTTQVPTPEFTDQPYFWLKESNELVELTKEIADMKSGGMSLKAKYKFEGPSSKTKILSEKPFGFVVSTTIPQSFSSMKLYKCVQKKKYREAEFARATFGTVDINSKDAYEFKTKKLGDDVYELVLSVELEKGEYVITNGMITFSFSIE